MTPATSAMTPLRRSPEARCRLFCFPYAGGSAAIFRDWQLELDGRATLVPVELPGRGTRFRDPLFTDVKALAAHLCDELQAQFAMPTVFFGHSNGAVVAYALSLEMRRRNLPLPKTLVLAAKPAPHVRRTAKMHALPHSALVARLAELGGMNEDELTNADLLDLFIPILRADFALSEEYEAGPEPPLDCALVTLCGDADAEALPEEVADWSRYFNGEVQNHIVCGDHFFLRSNRFAVLNILEQAVREALFPSSYQSSSLAEMR